MVVRPKFTDDLDKTKHVPKTILAEYHFGEEVPCGLRSCKEPHLHGILFACEDETESNMGHKCAQRHFPDQYDAMRKSFSVRRKESANLDVLNTFRARRDEIRELIEGLWQESYGARWAHKCNKLFRDQCPQFVQDRLFHMAKSGDWKIYSETLLRRDDEDSLNLGYTRNDQIEREIIGEVRGGNALKISAKDILKKELDQLNTYDAIEHPESLNARSRLKWAQWIGSIDANIDQARALIHEARSFYARDNLAQLLKLCRTNTEKAAVRRMLDSIEEIGNAKRWAS